jgi:hypothetical protein
MPTQCSRDLFGYEVVEGRRVVAAFDGGEGTTDAGGLLLGATDRTIHLVGRFAACFVDHRALAQVEHTVAAMVAQRVFGIVLGYEDLIDHDQVRHAPVLAVLAGKLEAKRQNGAPLDASTGAKDELARIVGQIRARWPRAKVLQRGDSGFARDELMTWCETNGVDYVFGLARNERLVGAIADDLATAALASWAQGGPVRRFADFACWAARLGNGAATPFRRPSTRQLKPGGPGRGQGGAPAQGCQSTLRRHLTSGHRDRRARPV